MDAEKLCCVRTCKRPRSPGTPLHGFPNPVSDPERFRTWLYAVGPDILGLENQYIYKYRNICRKHFEGKYHLGKKKLSNIAVPTINMPGICSTKRQAMADITRKTLNIEDNVAMPSTSKGINVPQSPGTSVPPKTTLQVGGSKKQYFYKKETLAMAKTIAKLKLKQQSYAARLRKAKTLSENTTFMGIIKKFTTLASIFILMQFREIKNPKMGRRFSQEEKIMALSLYKQSPKAYRWLSKVFVLPSSMTLSRLIGRISLRPGINENVFKQLKKVARKMNTDEKLCVLLFDEIALSPHFDYNNKKDKITGYVDNGVENQRNVADHALVFMIRGIIKNYKQPISFTFCSGSTKKIELARQIKENIVNLQYVGFNVIATVCDQGASNVSAINYLIEERRRKCFNQNVECRRDVFEINDQEVIPLYDPPHLIKGIRNNLITKNLICKMNEEWKTAKWSHLQLLYQEDPGYKGIKLMKNLSEAHVNPEKMNKQKVKYATQIFSQTVASNMGYLANKNILPEECKETADILIFFDNLFDSVNGSFQNSKKRSGKELLRQVTPSSMHEQVWCESKKILSTMKFVNSSGRQCTPPSISNWIKTIDNLQYLTKKLFTIYNFKSLWLRHLNQDPLENFFGTIRSHGAQNINPSCAAFEGAFASLLINNINSNYSPGSNCEKDKCKAFKQISQLLNQDPKKTENNITELDFRHIDANIIENILNKKNNPRIIAALEYVTGYVLRKASEKIFKNCKICRRDLYSNDTKDSYIKIREYKAKNWLTYPSHELQTLFSAIQDITINILRTSSNIRNLKEYIKLILCMSINTTFISCKNHKDGLVKYLLDLSTRFFIYNWCRDTNKLLKGTRANYDEDDLIQNLCKMYYEKRKKK